MNRSEYLAHSHDRQAAAIAHRAYYAQFVDASVIAHVVQAIRAERLRASVDPHMNDIPLGHWDGVTNTLGPLPVSFQSLGDFPTLGGLVCVAKEAARQYLENAQ